MENTIQIIGGDAVTLAELGKMLGLTDTETEAAFAAINSPSDGEDECPIPQFNPRDLQPINNQQKGERKMIYANLSDGENDSLRHVTMWGETGYPVLKLGKGKWTCDEFYGVKISSQVCKTKRECVAIIDRYLDGLRIRARDQFAQTAN